MAGNFSFISREDMVMWMGSILDNKTYGVSLIQEKQDKEKGSWELQTFTINPGVKEIIHSNTREER